MNHPFLISLIMHLSFCLALVFFGSRSRPHAMTVPVQTIQWVNIAPPVAATPAIETPKAIKTKAPAHLSKPKTAEATAVVPEKPREIPESKPTPENAVSSPAPLPEATAEPTNLAQTAAAGLPGATGMKVDDPNFTFIYYLNIIRNRIQEYWRPPRVSGQSLNQQTMVVFKITKSGKISGIRVEQSSGNFLFDQAAQRALYETASLPPLPDEYGGQELTVHIEFESLR